MGLHFDSLPLSEGGRAVPCPVPSLGREGGSRGLL